MESQRWLMGNYYLEKNQYREALECYKTIDRCPKIYFNIAMLHIQRQSYRKAIIAFQKSLELKTSAIAYFGLACVYLTINQSDKAMDHFVFCLESMNDEQVNYASEGLEFTLYRQMVESGDSTFDIGLFYPPSRPPSNMSEFKSERELWKHNGPMPAYI